MKTKLLLLLLLLARFAFAQPANDACTNAQNIDLSALTAVTINFNNTTATQSLQSSCDNTSNTYLDVWYSFTMPVNGNIHISGVNLFDRFTLYDSCGGTEIKCFNDDGFFYSLTLGTTYLLRVANKTIYAGAKSFDIQAFETAFNDECVNATSINVTTASATNVTADTRSASQSVFGSCENTNQTWNDLWYTFTMPVNGNIRINGVNLFDNLVLYDTCGGNEIKCTWDNSFFYNLTMGTTYTLRFSNRDIYADAKSFNIQAFETASNDECANAISISVTTASTTNVTTETRSASQSVFGSCENTNQTWNDLWYTFTMPVNGNIRISNADLFDIFVLYDACAGNEIKCTSDNSFFYNLTIGTIYTLRFSNRDIYAGAKSFDIQAFETAPNDGCVNALTIQVAQIGQCSSENVSIDLRTASESSLNSCLNGNNTYLDVWYTFEAPLTGNITLNYTSGVTYTYFTVYDNCNGNEITCFSNGGTIPVVYGQTYVLQVSKWEDWANPITFCLEGAPLIAPGISNNCESIPIVNISTASGNTNTWTPILDTSGKIVAAINANGNDLGDVATSLFIDNATTRQLLGQDYLRREVTITPQNQPTSYVSVRLYLSNSELDDLVTADVNLDDIHGLELMKVSGNGCTTGYTSGGSFINSGGNTYGNDYYINFNINSFSVFYPSSTNLANVLSIETSDEKSNTIIYPTITDGTIYVKTQLSNEEVTNIHLFDLNGRLVYQTKITLNSNAPETINISKLNSGLYFMKITNRDKYSFKKIIKK